MYLKIETALLVMIVIIASYNSVILVHYLMP